MHEHKKEVKFAVYALVFLYPVLSVKLLKAFACHEVDGTQYLKADYSVRCASKEWRIYRAYAVVWFVLYVMLFPAYLFHKLLIKYPRKISEGDPKIGSNGHTKGVKDFSLYFLMEDYKTQTPAMNWEGFEMVRKLMLCCVGAMYAKKSVMCVSTAFFLSSAFSYAHFHYYPYKSMACNRLQSACLTALNIIYFIGVLLKAEVVEQEDMDHLGYFLVRYTAHTAHTSHAYCPYFPCVVLTLALALPSRVVPLRRVSPHRTKSQLPLVLHLSHPPHAYCPCPCTAYTCSLSVY
jgi:hypothetical protein